VFPEIRDTEGRGSSRIFSDRNYLEFAVALRLREMMLPVGTVAAALRVLRVLEQRLQSQTHDFSLTDSLRVGSPPDLRIIISDGRELFFSLGRRGEKPKLFGGVPLEAVNGGNGWDGEFKSVHMPTHLAKNEVRVGGPEGSRFGRLELSVTAVAQSLDLAK
jgi:hypothetical protein